MTEHQPAYGKAKIARKGEAGARAANSGFWHRPDWMNLVSGALIVLASLMFSVAAFQYVVKMPLFSLREVVILSSLGHVTHTQLRGVASASLRGNFFTIDLEHSRKAFEKLPWVRKAQLRRIWPGVIEVSLEEQVAVAYWRSVDSGDTRLVNAYGELFDAAANDSMPVFSGPADSSVLILGEMRRFNELLQPIQRKVVAITLSGRHAWQIKLDDGLVIELGKDLSQDREGRKVRATPAERLERFVVLWPQTKARLGRPALVADLRYQSGFALRVASEQRKGTQ